LELALLGLPDALWIGAGLTLLVSLVLLFFLIRWGRSLGE
jgi:hypothetical protein